MTNKRVRMLTVGAVLGWVIALALPLLAQGAVAIEVLILMNMVVLSAAITATVLAVIVRALPPVAAAWFLGYRERVTPQRDDGGRRLRSVGS